MLTGALLCSDRPAFALFDSGAFCLFISSLFAALSMLGRSSPLHVNIGLPSGKDFLCDRKFLDVPIIIGEVALPADLLVLDLADLDVILGVDWLTLYLPFPRRYLYELQVISGLLLRNSRLLRLSRWWMPPL